MKKSYGIILLLLSYACMPASSSAFEVYLGAGVYAAADHGVTGSTNFETLYNPLVMLDKGGFLGFIGIRPFSGSVLRGLRFDYEAGKYQLWLPKLNSSDFADPIAEPFGSIAYRQNGAINMYYDFKINKYLAPYIGFGVGFGYETIAHLDTEQLSDGGGNHLSGEGNVNMWQVIVGLSYLSQSLPGEGYIEFRNASMGSLSTTPRDTAPTGTPENTNVKLSMFTIGIGFRFIVSKLF